TLLSGIVFSEWQTAHATAGGLEAMGLVNRALVAAEKVRLEPGPSNGVLGDADRPDPAKRARLAAARAVSDAALSDLDAAVAAAPQTPNVERARAAIVRAHAQVRVGRAAIDEVSSLPHA